MHNVALKMGIGILLHRCFSIFAKYCASTQLLVYSLILSSSISADELELSTIFGNSDYLNKKIMLVGYLSAAPSAKPTNAKGASILPMAYLYKSELAFSGNDKERLFFDWPAEFCRENNCGDYLGKRIKVNCEVRYLPQPVNFHSVTNIVSIEVLGD